MRTSRGLAAPRSVIEPGRTIVIVVETPGQGHPKLVGYIDRIAGEAGGVATELAVNGEAKPVPLEDDE